MALRWKEMRKLQILVEGRISLFHLNSRYYLFVLAAGRKILMREMRFVQFYKILSSESWKWSKIDKCIGYVRIRWHRTEGQTGVLSSATMFGLVSRESISRKVHLVLIQDTIKDSSDFTEPKKRLWHPYSWRGRVAFLSFLRSPLLQEKQWLS